MSDFTNCVSTVCHRNKDCYRFRAIPSKKQSYANFYENMTLGKPLCKDFIEIIPGDRLTSS